MSCCFMYSYGNPGRIYNSYRNAEAVGEEWMLITHGCQMAQANTEADGQRGGAGHVPPSFVGDCYDTQH